MATTLYLKDHYLKEFDATVVSVKEGKFVVLDQTAFYPNSGGQPFDTGVLIRGDQKFRVLYVGKFDGEISHEVEPGLAPGDRVHGVIDWDRRYRLMRMHTASHILSAIFHREAGALITGNQLGLDSSRIDFSLENFDRDAIQNYVAQANSYVKATLPVSIKFISRDEALQLPGLVKLAKGLPPAITEIRLLEIKDVDTQPDGGTHVANTSEVGTIELLDMENKGKNNRRLYFTLK